MARGSLAVLALMCAMLAAGPARAQPGDGSTGLYEPFPEPSSGGGSSLFGAESERSAARRAFAARLRTLPDQGGTASARAGAREDLLGLPPLSGPLLVALGVLVVHGLRRRLAARQA